MAGKLLLLRRHLPYNPPMFTDTHCHLADPALLPQLPEVLAAARAANVRRFIVPATCRADWAAVLALGAVDIHSAIGIHPWFAAEAGADDLAALSQLLAQHPQALVGEIGLGSLLLNPAAKKARQAAAALPLEHIVLETDSPFMLKNQTNTPANVRAIAETVAGLRGISVEALSMQTEINVTQLLAFHTNPKK